MNRPLPTDEDVQRQLQSVRAQVMRTVTTTPFVRSRTARGLAVAGVAGLLLTGGAFVITATAEDQASYVRCYETTSLESHHVDVFNVTYSDKQSARSDADLDPRVSCADLAWAVGAFEPDADPHKADPIYPVPSLTACRFTNGIAAVFPNEEKIPAQKLCGALGLAVWEPISGV